MDKRSILYSLEGRFPGPDGNYFCYNWIQKTATAKAKPQEMQKVVVAAFDVPWSTVLTKDMVRTATFLKERLPNGYYLDPAQIVGRTVIQPIRINEPVTEAVSPQPV
jgi:Flp pilus assembly protein CpaB